MADEEKELRSWLVDFSRKKPRYGYRRAHVTANKSGFWVNREKVRRIWRDEGLKVAHKAKKKSRVGSSATEAKRLEAEHPNHVCALDYQDDQTTDGHRLRLLNIVDEFTRQVLVTHVARSITADDTVQVLEELAETRGEKPSLHPFRQRTGTDLPCVG